eukprot:11501354-Karenia_brevis.AAC.1
MPHRWLGTKALLNGQRVDPSKVDTPWLFENALDRCIDLEGAARLADTFVFANALGAEHSLEDFMGKQELTLTCNQIMHD